MPAQARRVITARNAEERLELVAWVETELARHLEVNVEQWMRVAEYGELSPR